MKRNQLTFVDFSLGKIPDQNIKSGTGQYSQYGAVLIISMVMLLLLTIIATTGMQTTALEERMVGNLRDQNAAFQAAEAALRAGETAANLDASAITALPFVCEGNGVITGGYYDSRIASAVPCAQTPNWKTLDWTNPGKFITYNGAGMRASYYIELLDSVANDSDALETGISLDSGSSLPSSSWYRITARGSSNTGNAIIYLQSTYRR